MKFTSPVNKTHTGQVCNQFLACVHSNRHVKMWLRSSHMYCRLLWLLMTLFVAHITMSLTVNYVRVWLLLCCVVKHCQPPQNSTLKDQFLKNQHWGLRVLYRRSLISILILSDVGVVPTILLSCHNDIALTCRGGPHTEWRCQSARHCKTDSLQGCVWVFVCYTQ